MVLVPTKQYNANERVTKRNQPANGRKQLWPQRVSSNAETWKLLLPRRFRLEFTKIARARYIFDYVNRPRRTVNYLPTEDDYCFATCPRNNKVDVEIGSRIRAGSIH